MADGARERLAALADGLTGASDAARALAALGTYDDSLLLASDIRDVLALAASAPVPDAGGGGPTRQQVEVLDVLFAAFGHANSEDEAALDAEYHDWWREAFGRESSPPSPPRPAGVDREAAAVACAKEFRRWSGDPLDTRSITQVFADALAPMLGGEQRGVDREAEVRGALARANEALDEWAQGDEWAAPLRSALSDLAESLEAVLTGRLPGVDLADLRRTVVGAIRLSHGDAAEDVCCTVPERYADAVLAALAPLLGVTGGGE